MGKEFLKTVLNYVLSLSYRELENGEFPPIRLLERIREEEEEGKTRMDDDSLLELENLRDGDINRRKVLLELWSGEKKQKLVNFNEGLHEAFGISRLPNIPTLDDLKESVPEKTNIPLQDTKTEPKYEQKSNQKIYERHF